MPEAGPHNQDYTQHHPDAITDRDKAELMARASKQQEEEFAKHKRAAEEGMDLYAEQTGKGQHNEAAATFLKLDLSSRAAQQSREQADALAENVGVVYDVTKQRLESSKPQSQVDSPEAPQQ